MNLSPLQLKHYHFTSFFLRARPDFDIHQLESSSEPYPAMADIDLSPKVTLTEAGGEQGTIYLVTLEILHEPSEGATFPYDFGASIEGIFTIDHDGDETERKHRVVVNGASMLFGAIREQLLTLSARHRYGPMLLPSLSFRDLQPKPAE